MSNVEEDLSKLTGSEFYATFFLSLGYWQLALAKYSQILQFQVTADETSSQLPCSTEPLTLFSFSNQSRFRQREGNLFTRASS